MKATALPPVLLRPAEDRDLDAYLGFLSREDEWWKNDMVVPVTRATAWEWLTPPPGSHQYSLIFETADPTPRTVGLIELGPVEPVHARAPLGISIWNPKDRGRGLGGAALEASARLAFDHMNLNKLVGEINAPNTASIAMVERFGWVREGELRAHVFGRGAWMDVVVFGLLASDWRKRQRG